MTPQQTIAPDNDHSGLAKIFADVNRAKAYRQGRRHTWLVKFLRFSLPFVVIGLLGLTFFPIFVPKVTIKGLSVGAIETSFTGPTVMKNPHFEGEDEKNGVYSIDAATAEINITDQGRIPLTKIKVNVVHLDKTTTTLQAQRGLFDRDKNTMALSEHIELHNSTGMSAILKTAHIDMTTKNINSNDPVTVKMPQGQITSNKIQIFGQKKYVEFQDNVQLYMVPPAPKKPTTIEQALAASDSTASSYKPSATKKPKKDGMIGGMTMDATLPMTSTTDLLAISDTDKTAVLTGNVIVKQGAYDLLTNRLQINYANPEQKNKASKTPKGAGMLSAASGKINSITASKGLVIYTADGRSIQGESADFNMVQSIIKVNSSPQNKMIITSPQGTISAKKVVMQSKKKTIIFDKNVVAGMGKNKIKADHLNINTQTNIAQFDKNVHLTLYNNQKAKKKKKTKKASSAQAKKPGIIPVSTAKMDPTKPIKIAARRLKVNDKTKIAHFSGKVIAKQDTFTLMADDLKAYYSGQMQPMTSSPGKSAKGKKAKSEAGQIKKIIARKKVLMTSGDDQTVSGDKAEFNVVTNMATVSGNVVLSQKGNILKGDRLVLNLTTGLYRLKTKKGTSKSRVQLLVVPENQKAFKSPF